MCQEKGKLFPICFIYFTLVPIYTSLLWHCPQQEALLLIFIVRAVDTLAEKLYIFNIISLLKILFGILLNHHAAESHIYLSSYIFKNKKPILMHYFKIHGLVHDQFSVSMGDYMFQFRYPILYLIVNLEEKGNTRVVVCCFFPYVPITHSDIIIYFNNIIPGAEIVIKRENPNGILYKNNLEYGH
ncbi:hypothetical protein ACJX0J_031574, partial [Zea mays]